MAILSIENLNIKYKKEDVLQNINLTFETGHCYLLLGKNGAGKSSLFKAITSGSKKTKIAIDGIPTGKTQKQMSRIVCFGPETGFPEDFKIKDILSIVKISFPQFDTDFANSLLKQTDISPKQKICKLSIGQKSMFYSILSVSVNAEFVLMDEPELGIDIPNKEIFFESLAKKMSNCDTCYIIASHDTPEFQTLADRIVILNNKKVEYSGDIDALANQYVRLSGKTSDLISFKNLGKDMINLGSYSSIIVESKYIDKQSLLPQIDCSICELKDIFLALTQEA